VPTVRQLVDPRFWVRRRAQIVPFAARKLSRAAARLAPIAEPLGIPLPGTGYAALAGKHAGKPAFIVGNGPSLTIADLDALAALDVVTFAFNRIYVAYGETAFRPTYYMAEDPEAIRVNARQLREMEENKLFPVDYTLELMGARHTTFYPYDWTVWTPALPPFGADGSMVHWGGTVTYGALQTAALMGCSPIYLIGIDLSWAVPEVRDADKPDVIVSEGEQNHFHPDYRKPGETWFAPPLESQRLAYESAAQWSKRSGTPIYNATRGGALEAFERRDLDAVIEALKASRPR
jgi:hypothetical protein